MLNLESVQQQIFYVMDSRNSLCRLGSGPYDARREPRLYQIGSGVDRQKLRDGVHCIMLYDTETKACPFLDGQTKLCGIYATRPVACVMVEPGDAKCQQARKMKGLPLLRDRDGNEPSREVLEASCEDYELDVDEVM